MSLLSDIFTWWNGTTLSTRLYTKRKGQLVGEDGSGNKYYTEKNAAKAQQPVRRWVIYNGVAEASKVPPEWFAWLHHVSDDLPFENEPIKTWHKPHVENMTGTSQAWRPAGSILNTPRRRVSTLDYEPWRAE
ncbi:MAG: NADH:ubiquinone oxidoreductase subunit NDUFA12 [Alphaproteobacteria bacterium]